MTTTAFFQEHLLNLAMRQTPFPFPDDRYLSLWYSTPGTGIEVADANYLRLPVVFSPWASSYIVNVSDRLFPPAAAPYAFQFVALGTALTGGDILVYTNLGSQQNVMTGVSVRVKAGQIKLNVT